MLRLMLDWLAEGGHANSILILIAVIVIIGVENWHRLTKRPGRG